MEQEQKPSKIDFRIYIGILFFRWKIIVLCFLYCLLGGVLYLNLSPKKYLADCKIMIYQDPKLVLSKSGPPWASMSSHTYLLQSQQLRERVVQRLMPQWGDKIGDRRRMLLGVSVGGAFSLGPALYVSATSENVDYAAAFLSALVEEHQREWQSIQAEAVESATRVLSDELARLEEKIRSAEDDAIEYQRLHDVMRVDFKASVESSFLGAMIGRRSQIETEMMLMESQTPALKDANAGVLSDVERLTRETGTIDPLSTKADDATADKPASDETRDAATAALPPDFLPKPVPAAEKDPTGWPELRVKLVNLQQRERELLKNLTADHPAVKSIRDEIVSVQESLAAAAQVQFQRLQDHYQALKIQLAAVESAEYKWQAKNLLSRQRRAEYGRLASVISRYQSNHNTLYSRLHDLRVSEELESEHFRVVEPVKPHPNPFWPQPMRVLMIALAAGLGSGFGLALLMQVTDNKVQSINDVEKELGIPFLGGVPYWAHSGLEKAIRPIVTEENASGAIEAYRALRTSLLAALGKVNEKIALVTSADSREGKTLTALNIAIMIAQMRKKVLLVDLDLRRGRLHRSLGAAREPGMTDVLSSRGRLRDIIQKTRVDNLWLAPTGSGVDNASELMQGTDLVGMFADVQDDFDYIIIDTSPVLRVTDTVIAASQGLGVVVYVARVNKTSKPMIQYSLDMLKDCRVLGLIMNSIEMHRLSSLYYAYQYPNYAYYSNAYVYGYNYHHDDGMTDQKGWGGGVTDMWRRNLRSAGDRLRRLLAKED